MEAINSFFGNAIVSVLVGPIIAGVIVLFIGYISRNFWERRKISKQLDSIKIAETKFLDLVMPFILQKELLSEEILNDIRDGVIKEYFIDKGYFIDKDSFMTLNDLKKNLVYDICNTRYIDEAKKNQLMEEIGKCFLFLKDTDVETSYEIKRELESKRTNLLGKIIKVACTFVTMSLLIIGEFTIINIEFEGASNNSPNLTEYNISNILLILLVISLFISIILIVLKTSVIKNLINYIKKIKNKF